MYRLVTLFEKYIHWMFKIGYILGKLRTLNIKKFVNSTIQFWKIYTILYILWIMSTCNVHNLIYSLKNCVHWIYKIMYIFKKCVHWIYRIVHILQKIVYVKCTKFGTLFEKLCMFNVQNCVHFLKNVYIEFTKLFTFFKHCIY